MCLKIQLTDAGPVLELQGVSLKLTAQKDLSLTCESLEINAEKEMIMRTKGDMVQAADRNISIMAKGAMQTNASSQYLRARTGDFEVKANDDVLLDGERVRLNSPRQPAELKKNNSVKEIVERYLSQCADKNE